MTANALDLYLTVTYTDIVAWCIDSSGTSEHPPIAHAEARSMPGTFNNIAVECSLIQWPTSMRTGCRDSGELRSLAKQNHRDSSSHHTVELIFLNFFQRQYSLVLLARSLPSSVIDARTLGEHHITTQIGSIDHARQPYKADDDGNNVIAWSRTNKQSQEKGDKVEGRRNHVEEGMIKANAPLSTIGIAPIHETSHCRT